MELLTSTNAVIDALGGTSATARLLGWSIQRVSNRRLKANFPAETFGPITGALRDGGLYTATRTLWPTIPSSILDNLDAMAGAVAAPPLGCAVPARSASAIIGASPR